MLTKFSLDLSHDVLCKNKHKYKPCDCENR